MIGDGLSVLCMVASFLPVMTAGLRSAGRTGEAVAGRSPKRGSIRRKIRWAGTIPAGRNPQRSDRNATVLPPPDQRTDRHEVAERGLVSQDDKSYGNAAMRREYFSQSASLDGRSESWLDRPPCLSGATGRHSRFKLCGLRVRISPETPTVLREAHTVPKEP